MDKTILQFTIAERSYRLVIKPEERLIFEEAVRQIEIQMKRYAEHFEFKDKQDLLAMVALQYASELFVKKETEIKPDLENFSMEKVLKRLEEELNEVL